MDLLRSGLGFSVAAGLAAWFSPPALAHVQLAYPVHRYQDQKKGPCGKLNGTRTQNVTTLAPGATIEVIWDETVEHAGHFRISFDPDGHDDFVNPTDAADTNPTVLENSIPDRVVSDGDRTYTVSVTLPDIECDNCTLQLIQVMSTAPTYNPGDLYYQCADLVLSSDAPGDPDAGAGGEGDAGGPGVDGGPDNRGDGSESSDRSGDGCAAAGSRSSLGSALVLAVLLGELFSSRRRRVAGLPRHSRRARSHRGGATSLCFVWKRSLATLTVRSRRRFEARRAVEDSRADSPDVVVG